MDLTESVPELPLSVAPKINIEGQGREASRQDGTELGRIGSKAGCFPQRRRIRSSASGAPEELRAAAAAARGKQVRGERNLRGEERRWADQRTGEESDGRDGLGLKLCQLLSAC